MIKKVKKIFSDFGSNTATLAGNPFSFALSVAVVVIWGILGPVFHYSDTWQLVINTGTTIITFLMVFLLQNRQNRDGEAIQIKLDELIRGNKDAHNILLDVESLTIDELDAIKNLYKNLAAKAREDFSENGVDTMVQDITLDKDMFNKNKK